MQTYSEYPAMIVSSASTLIKVLSYEIDDEGEAEPQVVLSVGRVKVQVSVFVHPTLPTLVKKWVIKYVLFELATEV